MNILIVEDDLNIQKIIGSSIQEIEKTIRLFTSTSAVEALQIAEENPIDVFIFDIQLTDYKGTKLAKEIRAIPVYQYVPMIFATALANEELNAYREIKCYNFLIKPFTSEEVKQVVTEAIDYRQQFSKPKKTIRIEQKSHIFEYELDNILYIESFRKQMTLHLRTSSNDIIKEVISGYTLKSMLELMVDDSFIQVHKSFIINQQHMTQIDKVAGLLYLKDVLTAIPIGNKYRDQIVGKS